MFYTRLLENEVIMLSPWSERSVSFICLMLIVYTWTFH